MPTRRGGTDANAPERLRTAILQDWHVGMLGPHLLEILENCPINSSEKNIYYFDGTMIGRYEQWMHLRDKKYTSVDQILFRGVMFKSSRKAVLGAAHPQVTSYRGSPATGNQL